LPRLYADLATWWPLMSAPGDYAEEAALYRDALVDAAIRNSVTCLELGSGGGNNALFLKERFTMTLVEPSEGMLAHSRALNPQCEHVRGDMRDVRLGTRFDCVFVHDAVMYMTTEDDLQRAIETAFVHCADGGSALFCPDHVKENFESSTDHGGHDGKHGDRRAMRYLAWTRDPEPDDTTYTVDYAYVLREADGTTRVEHDRHIEGLFSRETWLRLLRKAGFDPKVMPLRHSELEAGKHEMFACTKAAITSAHKASVIDRLRRDVHATVGPGYEARIEWIAEMHREFTSEPDVYVERVVEDVQQRFHDEFIDTDWPACPVCRRHPMWLRDGAWGACDGSTVPLGELRSTK